MPQQSFDNNRTPWRITLELKEDPLSPSKPPVSTCTVFNGVGVVLDSASVQLPPGFACEAFAEQCKMAMEPYSFARVNSITGVWRRIAREWRRAAEDIAQTR